MAKPIKNQWQTSNQRECLWQGRLLSPLWNYVKMIGWYNLQVWLWWQPIRSRQVFFTVKSNFNITYKLTNQNQVRWSHVTFGYSPPPWLRWRFTTQRKNTIFVQWPCLWHCIECDLCGFLVLDRMQGSKKCYYILVDFSVFVDSILMQYIVWLIDFCECFFWPFLAVFEVFVNSTWLYCSRWQVYLYSCARRSPQL